MSDENARLAIIGGGPFERAASSDVFDDGWRSGFLLVDVVGSSKEKVGGVGDALPFGGDCFIDQGFLAKVRERVLRKGFDVVAADVGWIGDEGAVNSRFKLGDECAEAGGE